MEDYKLIELLNKIVLASEQKKIDWEKAPASEGAFKATLGTNTLYIIDSKTDFFFAVMSASGDQIGSLTGPVYRSGLRKLYELAKSKALKIDENLDEINTLLDNIL